MDMDGAATFLTRVKVLTAQDPQIYKDFVDTISDYKSNMIPESAAADRLKLLLRNYPELLSGLNRFLPPEFQDKPEDNSQDALVSCMMYQSSQFCPVKAQVHSNNPANLGFLQLPKEPCRPSASALMEDTSDSGSEEETRNLDLQRVGASYSVAPDNYHAPKSSHRDLIGNQVLNDVYLCSYILSENSPTTVTEQRQHRNKILDRREDECFEHEAGMEAMLKTLVTFKRIHGDMQHMSAELLAKFQLDERLGGTCATGNKKVVKVLYGESADGIIEHLMKQPEVTLPVVLNSLERKFVELHGAKGKHLLNVWTKQLTKVPSVTLHDRMNIESYNLSKGLQELTFNGMDGNDTST